MKKNIKPKSFFDQKRNTYLILAVIIVAGFISYLKVFSFDFVSLDDQDIIQNNPLITSFSWSNIKAIFASTSGQMYAPFAVMTIMTDYWLAGGPHPAVFHFSNLVFHLVNILLVYIFIRKLSGNEIPALVAAGLFAIHPMNVEAVAWVSSRSAPLYVIFGLLSMIWYLKYLENGQKLLDWWWSFLFFLVSMLFKSAIIVLPALLWLLDYYKCRKLNFKVLLDKIPFILVSAGFLLILLLARHADINKSGMTTFNWFDRLFFATYGLSFYLVKAVFPVHLTVMNHFPVKTGNYLPFIYYFSSLILLVLTLMLFVPGRMKRVLRFGIIFYVVNLVLVLQVLPFGFVVVSERYAYLPYIGLFLIIGEFFRQMEEGQFPYLRKYYPLMNILLILFAMVLTVITFNRTEVWKNSLTLFEDAAAKSPGSYYAHYAHGQAKVAFGRPGAFDDYTTCLTINPNFTEAYLNRGVLRENSGDLPGALRDYSEAIRVNPKLAEAYNNRGVLKDKSGDYQGALEDFNNALTINPDFFIARYNRGNSRLKTNDFRGAIDDYNLAIEAYPSDDKAITNRGTAWYNLNNPENAIRDWKLAAGMGNSTAAAQLAKYAPEHR